MTKSSKLNKNELTAKLQSAMKQRHDDKRKALDLNIEDYQKHNAHKELTSAFRLLTHDSAISYMLRYRFTLESVDAIMREAQKTITKIARTMIAIVDQNVAHLDKYTISVLRCAHYLAQDRKYDYQEIQSMMSHKVASNVSGALVSASSHRRHIEVTTTSTQTSTTIHMLAFLNLCDVETVNARKLCKFHYDKKALGFVFEYDKRVDE